MAMMSWLLGILLILISCETISADTQNVCSYKKFQRPGTPSGTYLVGTSYGNVIEVYCDMETDGGGYTFINPTFLERLTSEELAMMFTDKSSVQLCYRLFNGAQYCATVKQLPQYALLNLKLGLNENVGYKDPINHDVLNEPYLYLGFLSIASASNRKVQGLRVNGVDVTFTNCDANPNSQITFFPNFSGLKPSDYLVGVTTWPFCDSIFSNCVLQPANRNLPDYFFTFAEIHFGGCACYTQTNRRPNLAGMAIGFR